MSRLSLYLLGPPRIECDGEPIQVDTRKAIALLVYVAITGERHRRDALVNLLWPEYDQSRGRAALRRTLSALRRALAGDWLDIDRETVGLSPEADSSTPLRQAQGKPLRTGPSTSSHQLRPGQAGRELWLDVDQFHTHLAACRTHEHPVSDVCPACLPHLTAAVALYRGDFLSGFSLRDSFNFDDWQFFQTDALRRELGDALERLVQGHSVQGDLEAAIGYARQWLDLDRLNEAAHGQLMLLYAWSDRRSAALRQYQECVRILESNLGVSPQASTAELYKAIVEGRTPAPPVVPSLQRAEERREDGMPVQPETLAIRDRAGPAMREAPLPPLEGEKRILTVLFADIGRSLTRMADVSP
jgi:DNA-binding SARP family transcriptional activator